MKIKYIKTQIKIVAKEETLPNILNWEESNSRDNVYEENKHWTLEINFFEKNKIIYLYKKVPGFASGFVLRLATNCGLSNETIVSMVETAIKELEGGK